MKSNDPGIPVCEMCGCAGNCECGHESLNEKRGCTLDAIMVCPCCNACMGHEGYTAAIREEATVEKDAEIERLKAELCGASIGIDVARSAIGAMAAESASRLVEQKRRIVEAVHQLFAPYNHDSDTTVDGDYISFPYEDDVLAAIDKACEDKR